VTPEQIQGWLQLGLGGLMLAALFLGHRRIWVFGSFYSAMEKDRDEWKAIALQGLQTARDVAEAAKGHTVLTREEAEAALRAIQTAGKR
jgi:hypothetical protein